MTLSRKKLVCFFALFVALEAAFHVYLLLSSGDDFLAVLLGALFFDFTIEGVIGGLSPWAGLRFVGWGATPLILAFVCSGPFALLTGTGEAHGSALLMFPYLLVWGLVASGLGTLLGYFLRHFLTSK